MSLALYRKYRPATFAEVKGQEHVTEPLRQALRNGRVHHAYLFSGPRGCGKTTSARILARSLNCEQGPTPDPCGTCASCVALAPDGPGSIDVIEIDAASHGGVDDARDLRERAFFAPVSSRYKVYIIDEAHMVTSGGFNALLKLVEEPPPHLKFVFATTEPDKVIGTIRSRTHHYPFRLIPPGTLRELLEEVLRQESVRYEPAALPLVVRAGAGSARDALSVLDQLLAGSGEDGITYDRAVALLGYTDTRLLDEVVAAFAAGDGAAVFEAVNHVIESGHDPRRFTADLLERFRDLLVLATVPDAADKGLLDAPPDELEIMRGQAMQLGAAQLTRAAEIFHTGLTEMRGATAPRLLLELTCARVLLPDTVGDERSLLARLERLEQMVAGGLASGGGAAPSAAAPGGAGRSAAMAPGGARRDAATSQATQPPPAQGGRAPTPSSRGFGGSASLDRQTVDNGSPRPAPVDDPSARAPRPSPAPSGTTPDRTPPAGSATPAARPTAADRPLDVTAVRRAWPAILDTVKKRRRFAWMILIGDVAVLSVEDDTLTLGFARDGDLKGFTASGSEAVVRQALHDVLGVQWRISAVVDPGGASAATHPPAPTPPVPPRVSPTPSAGPTDRAPDPGPSPTPQLGGQPVAGPPDEPDPDHDDDGSDDTDDALTGVALVQRELGGEIIEEIDA